MKYMTRMSCLWKCFSNNVLKPLMYMAARCDVVFADLQIRWDFTSKVMVCDTSMSVLKFRLIDFESVTKGPWFRKLVNAFHYTHEDCRLYGLYELPKTSVCLVAMCFSSTLLGKQDKLHFISCKECGSRIKAEKSQCSVELLQGEQCR
jgi:hypothetical protein